MADARTAPAYPDEFLAEARELVQGIVVDVLALEEQGESPEPAILNRVFRAAHSLKGLAGMFGAQAVAQLAHALEDLLDALRLGRERLTRDVLDLLFDVPGALDGLLAGSLSEDQAAELAAGLRSAAGPAGRTPLPPPPFELPREIVEVLSEYEVFRLHEAARRGHHLAGLRRDIEILSLEEELGAFRKELGAFGEVISAVPTGSASPTCIGFHVLLASELTAGELAQALDQPVEAYPRIAPVTRDEHALTTPTRPQARSIRVDVNRIDALLHTVGELGATATNLQRLSERLQADDTLVEYGAALGREVRVFARRVRSLRQGILEARLVPLAPLFARMARVVRAAARDLGKDVGLETRGEETELDNLLVEALTDPLVQLLRNAVVHGVEVPGARALAKKQAKSNVKLEARAEGNRVIITVRDDGAGIDAARLRRAAVERGLLGVAEAEALPEADALKLIFLPGFTTRAEVSELSGRGVGLDVVKTNISRLSGTIEVFTEVGRGATFVLSLPVTLAIIPALVVRVGEELLAMPLSSVAETHLVRARTTDTVVSVRGLPVRSADLGVQLGLREHPQPVREQLRPALFVARGVDAPVALFVDEVLNQQDVVVKPLGALIGDVAGVSGVAELGDGELVLVLDPSTFALGFAR